MPTAKPTKPSITIPSAFGTSPSNIKTAYTPQELIDGYSASVQQVYDGGNLNWSLDAFFQYHNYTTAIADWLNGLPASSVPFINSSNQLDSATPVLAGANNTFTGDNTFAGTITATTQPTKDSSTKVATTEMVHNLADGMRSNCITDIPQDIKLDCVAGTSVTIKAGTKLYCPNGFESDGTTPHFDEITVSADIVRNTAFATTSIQTVLYTNGTTIFQSLVSANTSGTTAPSAGNFYNTSTNTLKLYSGGSVSIDNVCLPLAIVTLDASGFVKSIDRVFNGFCYHGSTAYALKGVSGLIPNGRNADGTLNNIAYTVPRILVRTWTYQAENQPLALSASGGGVDGITSVSSYYESDTEPVSPTNNYVLWYDTRENVLKYSGMTNSWAISADFLVTSIITSSDSVANGYRLLKFTDNKQVFKAVDANTSRTVVVANKIGNDWYRLWSDGWIEQGGVRSGTAAFYSITYLKAFADNTYVLVASAVDNDTNYRAQCAIINAKTTTGVKIANAAEGVAYTNQLSWYACGY